MGYTEDELKFLEICLKDQHRAAGSKSKS